MIESIVLLAGASHLSTARSRWIEDYLSLFEPFIGGLEPCPRVWYDGIQSPPIIDHGPRDLIVEHEICQVMASRLSDTGAFYLDVRVSPIRFMAHDNLFALGTNHPELTEVLAAYAVEPAEIVLEARALRLSLRYRDLGQDQIAPGSLVFFTEQRIDRDSINFAIGGLLDIWRDEIAALADQYPQRAYIMRAGDSEKDVVLLESLGFRRLDSHLYAALASDRVAAVATVRSGVIAEARTFGKQVHALDRPTTALWDGQGRVGPAMFVNVAIHHVLSSTFWDDVRACVPQRRERQTAFPRSQNLIRRALNNWNSSATGLELRGQRWQELVAAPMNETVEILREEVAFSLGRAVDQPPTVPDTLQGSWRWFSGDIVTIESDGHVHCHDDYSVFTSANDAWEIHWVRRQLIDTILGEDRSQMMVRNQYGDGGVAWRI